MFPVRRRCHPHAFGERRRHPQQQPRQDDESKDGAEEIADLLVVDPGIAVVAPGDGLALGEFALHRLELIEILRRRELRAMRLEALDKPAVAGERIETRKRRTVIAGEKARHADDLPGWSYKIEAEAAAAK